MKALSGKALCRLLERHGWRLLRVQGSHHLYGKADSAHASRSRCTATVRSKLGLQQHLLKFAGIADDDVR